MKTARSSLGFTACLGLAFATFATLAQAATVSLEPVKDNSIYSESGSNSNGGGGLYAGRTAPAGGIRRALVQFDIAGSLPAGAVINSVSVSFMQVKVGAASSATFELHPLTKDWGEGTTTATGTGGAAGNGDATWGSAANGMTLWTNAGGDFAATSGTATFNIPNLRYSFASTSGLVADVQGWLNNPSTNFGWLLRSSDEVNITARELGSRENPVNQRPSLTINYSVVPEPASTSLSGAMLLLGCTRRRR